MPTPYIVQVETGDFVAYGAQDGNGGPYEHGGAAYVIAWKQNSNTGDLISASAYKSTDGQNWVEQDSANAPVATDPNCSFGIGYPNAGGSRIHVCSANPTFPSTSAPMQLKYFDMADDAWHAVATGGPTVDAFLNTPNILIVPRSNGDLVIQFSQISGGQQQSFVVVYSSGWGIPALVSSGYGDGDSAHPILIGITDSDDAVLVWYSFTAGPNTVGSTYANTFSSGNVLSANATALASMNDTWDPSQYNFATGWNDVGKFITSENKIGWALPFWKIADGVTPTMLIADTSVSPATFTTEQIFNYSNADSADVNQFWIDFARDPSNGNLSAMWTFQSLAAQSLLVESTSTLLGGAWGAPSNFYVEQTDPPVPAQSVDGTCYVSVRFLSGGLSLVVGLFSTNAGQQAQYAIAELVAPPTLTIACPIAPLTATVGVLFTSDAPVVSGDTPPDTFALLSGPAWMTIDAGTGVVSGTPTFEGSVTYTIQVTDSLGNIATVEAPCPLTVSNPIPPPPFCILPPATGQENLVLVNEPLENQGT